MKSYSICLASNEKYLPYCGVTIQSILCNIEKTDQFHIHILHNGIEEKQFAQIIAMQTENVSISFIDVRPYLKFDEKLLKTVSYFSEEMYNRILIPTIFKEYDKVLYVDCDLVFNCNPKEIFDIDIGDNLVGAVKDFSLLMARKGEEHRQKEVASLGIKPDEYFNSGVLLMNVAQLNQFNLYEKFTELLTKDTYPFPDQDILNVICYQRVYFLDFSFNFQRGSQINPLSLQELYKLHDNGKKVLLNDIMIAYQNPKIIHFTGAKKPWHDEKYDLFSLWATYCISSPFGKQILYQQLQDKLSAELKNVSKIMLLKWTIKSKIPHKKQQYYFNKLRDIEKKRHLLDELLKN